MTITIITINFNGTDDTIRLLDSLHVQTDTDFDTIIVDNDSEQSARESLGAYVTTYSGLLDVIYSSRNLGFSGGNNLGIRKALPQKAEWILLLNNDTTVLPNFISDVRALISGKNGIISLPIQEGERVAYAGRVQWCVPTLHHIYHPVKASAETYAIGAGLLIHRDVFEHIGLLDESYFLYFEDADFSLRAQRAGIPIEHATNPIISHAVSSSTKKLGSALLLRYHLRNSILYNRRYAPIWARCFLPFVLTWGAFKQITKLALGLHSNQSRALLAGLRDAIVGYTGKISQRPIIAIECESLEDTSWGTARLVRGLMTSLVAIPEIQERYDIIAYFKSHIPDEPWLKYPHVRAVVVRPFAWLPESFSLYFYMFFPIRVWLDRPAVTYIANYMLPLIFIGKSVVLLTEDVWYEIRQSTLPLRYRIAYGIFATWAAKRATRIMAITNASAVRIQKLFDIPNNRIAVNELAVTPAQPVQKRDGEYMLYVAQGLPRRHLRETIQAFALIAPEYPELTLYAVGPDKYNPPCIAKLVHQTNQKLGRDAVIWVQRLSDSELASAYAGAKLFVYVSDMEAFGLPPVEALAYGIPSVLMDTPVHREIFGENAFYTKSAEPIQLAQVLQRGLNDTGHRQTISEAAQSIISRYTWEKHAHRMLAIIKDIERTAL